jgi:hypothetical protein
MENTVTVTESSITVTVIPEVVNVTATVGSATGSGGGGGVTDHGDLTGLADDDHTQYFNNTRGDARYSQLGHGHAIIDVTGLQTALDGKAATSHTHIIGDVTGLQTALDGKAAASHTHVIADVTGLQTALDGKQAAGSYAAATHTHVIADVTGLQTALDGKQATLVSGTNIRTVNGNSLLGSGNISTVTDEGREILKSLGLSIIAESFGRSRSHVTTAVGLADNQVWWAPIILGSAQTITGIGFLQGVQGVYTADGENRLGLYTLSGGTFTRVALTANDGNLWKGTAQTEQRAALTTPYSAAAGVYWVVGIYCQSAQTTAPSVGAYPGLGNAIYSSTGLTGGARTAGFISGQTSLAATYTGATVTNTANQIYFFVY